MRSALWLALAMLLVLLAGCGRKPLPTPTVVVGIPEIGAPYQVIAYCQVDFQLGDTWWRFDNHDQPWPPEIPDGFLWWRKVSLPYAVPAIVTLASPD